MSLCDHFVQIWSPTFLVAEEPFSLYVPIAKFSGHKSDRSGDDNPYITSIFIKDPGKS